MTLRDSRAIIHGIVPVDFPWFSRESRAQFFTMSVHGGQLAAVHALLYTPLSNGGTTKSPCVHRGVFTHHPPLSRYILFIVAHRIPYVRLKRIVSRFIDFNHLASA